MLPGLTIIGEKRPDDQYGSYDADDHDLARLPGACTAPEAEVVGTAPD